MLTVTELETDPMRPKIKIPLTTAIAVGVLVTLASVFGIYHAVHSSPNHALTNSQASTKSIDLLTEDWAYMPGVSSSGHRLTIQPTDFKIVKQDGSGGQANPPVNLYGTHLVAKSDFSVSATLSNVSGNASLQLYNAPPVIADEFRIEPVSIRLTRTGSDLEVKIWNGAPASAVTSPQPVYDKHFKLLATTAPLTVARSGNSLQIASGSSVLTDTKQGGLFTSGNVWLGLDSTKGGYQVTSFKARGNGLQTVDTAKTTFSARAGLQSLATSYRPGFKIGAAVALGPLVSDSTYDRELVSNFGLITPENAMKAQFIAPSQGVYDFQGADALLAFASANNIAVHGHTLAFSEAEPAWMRNLATATAAERQSTQQILLQYVTTVTTHFKGKLVSLDAINEPLDADGGTSLQQNIWYKAMGSDYLVKVSQAVYAADPNVEQYINENGAEEPGDRQDALYNLATQVNQQGGHIYGVGLQSHVYSLDTDTISADDLNQTIDRFAAAGLHIRISEMDVTDESGTAQQAEQYKTVLLTCINNPNCVSFTSWGIDDRYDVFQDDDGSLQYGHDLLFNKGTPTPAVMALTALLRK